MKTYYICGFALHLECFSNELMNERCKQYEKDCNDFQFDDIVDRDIYVTSVAVENIEDEQGNIIEENENLKILEKDGAKYCFMSVNGENVFKVSYFDNYKRTKIEFIAECVQKYSDLSVFDLEYLYIGGAFALRVGVQGGIMIHSSAIMFNGGALLFSAPSGTGKSTHTNLWKEKFGDKVQFINDDKPIIMYKNGIPYACGTPFSGKTDINNNICCPLKAYVYLTRGKENTIARIGAKSSIFYLTEQTIKTTIDSKIFLRNLQAIEKIVETTPCYELACRADLEAVEVVYKEIFNVEDK